ncbi:MAG: hypothetical protein VX527_11895 [Planctomycetota bacterium]|nr:hypothetical protein [Planctomycetota bacterium]
MIAKRTIPLLLAAIVGFLMLATYFVPETESYGATAMEMFIIISAAAMILGGGNLLKINLAKMSQRRPGWGYAGITLAAFIGTLIIGLFKIGATPTAAVPGHSWAAPIVQEGAPFWWIYQYMIVPLTATMFAMLAFYIASAAFRAFRAKNPEAILLLATAFIVLLGQVYAGYWLTNFLPNLQHLVDILPESDHAFAMIVGTQLEGGAAWWQVNYDGLSFAQFTTLQQEIVINMDASLNDWFWQFLNGLRLENLSDIIGEVPQKAGFRAIVIGIALGVVSTSLKVILGVDRSYLGSE